MTIKVNQYPVGILADAHTHTGKIDAIRVAHPEISQWIINGDLFSFNEGESNKNEATLDWLYQNYNKYHFTIGNHCKVIIGHGGLSPEVRLFLLATLKDNITLELPNGKSVFVCHNKPRDLWTFINPGYSEHEFVDDFAGWIDNNYSFVITAHGHKALRHVFQGVDTELYSIGAAKDGEYALLTEKGVEFKKL